MSNPNLPLGIALVCGAAACALTLAVSDVGTGGGIALGAVVAGAALIFQGQKPEEKEVESKKQKVPKKQKKTEKVAHTPSSPPQAAPSVPAEQKKPKKKSKKAEKPEAAPKSPAPKSPTPKSPAPKTPAPKASPPPAQQKPKTPQVPQKAPSDEAKELTKTQLQKIKKKQKKESEEKAKADEKALAAKREAAQAKKAAKAVSKKKEPVTPPSAQASYSDAEEDTKEEEVLEDGWEKPKPRNTVRIRSPQDEKKRRDAKARSLPTPSAEGPKTVSEVRVPKQKHGLIIGKGGATRELIQKHTGASIQMPKREGGGLGVVISGTEEQVKEASQIIRDLAIKGYSQLTHPNFQSGEIVLENDKQVGRIAGAGGVYLRQIQKSSGATLQLPEKNAAKAVITISGKLDQITNAKLAIMSLLDQGYSEYTHPGWVTEEHDFQHDLLGRLIGPGGATIQELSEKYDVKIETPKRDADVKQDTIVIKGKPSSIEQVKEAIAELTAPRESVPEELPVPSPDDPWNQDPQEAEW